MKDDWTHPHYVWYYDTYRDDIVLFGYDEQLYRFGRAYIDDSTAERRAHDLKSLELLFAVKLPPIPHGVQVQELRKYSTEKGLMFGPIPEAEAKKLRM